MINSISTFGDNRNQLQESRNVDVLAKQCSFIKKLPTKLFSEIVGYCSSQDLAKLCLVDRCVNGFITGDGNLWQKLICRDFTTRSHSLHQAMQEHREPIPRGFLREIYATLKKNEECVSFGRLSSFRLCKLSASPRNIVLGVNPLFLASTDNKVLVWEHKNGTLNLIATLIGHTHLARSVAIDPITKWIVSGDQKGSMCIWKPNGDTWSLAARLDAGFGWRVGAIAIDPSTRRIVSGSGRMGCVWEPNGNTWRLVAMLHEHNAPIVAIAIDPINQQIVTGSKEKICVWKHIRNEWSLASSIRDHSDFVTFIIDPKTQRIISGSKNGIIRVWEPNGDTWNPVATLNGHINDVRNISLDPNTQIIVSGSNDHTVRIWNPDGASWRLATTLPCRDGVCKIVLNPKTWQIFAGEEDGSIRVWQFDSRPLVGRVKARIDFRDSNIDTRLTDLTEHPLYNLFTFLPLLDKFAFSLVNKHIACESSISSLVILRSIDQRRIFNLRKPRRGRKSYKNSMGDL